MTFGAGKVFRALNPSQVRARLESGTPTAVALATGSAVTVASWLVDRYGSRGGELVLTKSDGSRLRRRVTVRVNSPAGGIDATTATPESSGSGTHADFNHGTWLDSTDVNGSGASQVVRLRITATANGPSWSAVFYPDFLKAS